MTLHEIKRVNTLKMAFNKLLNNCVDKTGLPKKPTAKQLYTANKALTKFIKESKLHEL